MRLELIAEEYFAEAHKSPIIPLLARADKAQTVRAPLIPRISDYWLNMAFEQTQTIAEDENET